MGLSPGLVPVTAAGNSQRGQNLPTQPLLCRATNGFPSVVSIWLREAEPSRTITYCTPGQSAISFAIHKEFNELAVSVLQIVFCNLK